MHKVHTQMKSKKENINKTMILGKTDIMSVKKKNLASHFLLFWEKWEKNVKKKFSVNQTLEFFDSLQLFGNSEIR
jgi:hypothetical protein